MLYGTVGRGIGLKHMVSKEKDTQYVYRSKITINGITYYAKAYGKKAFKIPVNKLK